MMGVMPTSTALKIAQDRHLDLVEITPNAQPPVCKIMDYGKFRYEESIKAKKARKAQKVQQVKEIKFHAATDTGDLEHKLRQVRGFLSEGNKVKLSLQYRGRENAHRELGEELIARVLEMLKDDCTVEQPPKLLGKVLGCLIGPRKTKGAAKPNQPAARQEEPESKISIKIS